MGLSKSHFTGSQTYKQGKHPPSRPESCWGEKSPCRWDVGGGDIGWQEPWRRDKENCEQRDRQGEVPGGKRGGGREDPWL